MEKTVQNLLQCLRNVICGEDVPLIAMSETEQEKFYQMSLAQDMAHLISAAGQFSWTGVLSVKVNSGDVNAAREMTITIVRDSAIESEAAATAFAS